MSRETMILQILKFELEFLISNPEMINDIVIWIPFLQSLSDEQILNLWQQKFVD